MAQVGVIAGLVEVHQTRLTEENRALREWRAVDEKDEESARGRISGPITDRYLADKPAVTHTRAPAPAPVHARAHMHTPARLASLGCLRAVALGRHTANSLVRGSSPARALPHSGALPPPCRGARRWSESTPATGWCSRGSAGPQRPPSRYGIDHSAFPLPFLDLSLHFHCLSLTFRCIPTAFRSPGTWPARCTTRRPARTAGRSRCSRPGAGWPLGSALSWHPG